MAVKAPVNVQGEPGSARRDRFEKVRKQAIASLKKLFHNRPGIRGFMSEKAMEKHSDFRLLKGDSKELKRFKIIVRTEMNKIDPSIFGSRDKAPITKRNPGSPTANIIGNLYKAAEAKVKK